MLTAKSCQDLSLLQVPGSVARVAGEECVFAPTDTFVQNENGTDDFVLILPSSTGQVEVQNRGGAVVYNSVTAPGIIRVLSPGEKSALRVKTAYQAIVLRVPASVCHAAARSLGFEGPRIFGGKGVLRPKHSVAALIPWFRDAVRTPDEAARQLVLPGLTNALLLALCRAADRAERSGPAFTSGQLNRLLDHADSRLAEQLNLDDWAEVVGMPAREFARRFRGQFGLSPYTWFLNERIDRAMRYLADTSLSLDEVAELTGFSSQSHFSAAFRRRVGMPPGRWRASDAGRPDSHAGS